MRHLFELRHQLSKEERRWIEGCGAVMFIGAWWLLSYFQVFKRQILPPPLSVLTAFPELHFEYALVRNMGYSLKVNILAYLEAVAIALPLGFAIGLLPIFRGVSERLLTALRYLPVTALTGLILTVFGIGLNAKVQFLVLGMIVYLIGAVVQRVDEVKQVYVDTVTTLGAGKWQTFRTVYFPGTLSTVSTDIINLVPITWTYLMVAEGFNYQDGGLGALGFGSMRAGRWDMVYATLIIILAIGFLQDKLFLWVDRKLFRYKYVRARG